MLRACSVRHYGPAHTDAVEGQHQGAARVCVHVHRYEGVPIAPPVSATVQLDSATSQLPMRLTS